MARAVLLALLLLPALPAAAHDLWVERAGELHTLLFGHLHPHGDAARLPYELRDIETAACFGSDGTAQSAQRGDTAPLTLTGSCAASRFALVTGYWQKTAYGTRPLPAGAGSAPGNSWVAVESVKRVDRWSPALARPLTAGLELVPLTDPAALKAGDRLRVAVYFDGRPLAGKSITWFDDPRATSAADGSAEIAITAPGLQLIQVSNTRPLADGRVARREETAALQFEVAR